MIVIIIYANVLHFNILLYNMYMYMYILIYNFIIQSRELVTLVSADNTAAGREKRIKMFPCLNTNMLADLLEKVS